MMTSYDTHGPVIRPRTAKLWTRVDPLGFRNNFRYNFEMDILDSLETESFAVVQVAGKTLKQSSTYNDYYGFGTSRAEAIKSAEAFAKDLAGANVDIVVTTTLKSRAVFFDDKTAPFYNGAVRCFCVPRSWSYQEGDEDLESEETFETWKNGTPGIDAERLDQIIAETMSADAAGERRNGALR